MSKLPSDSRARERFRTESSVNFAVVAGAGSGKTRAISERVAAIALAADSSEVLERTAVVTYTNKAADEIAERARSVLRRRMQEAPSAGAEPVVRLEKAFFGTIHSFCLLLARRHGSTIGVHLNPALKSDGDEALWQEFLDQDPMTFSAEPSQIAGFLRHQSIDIVFPLAQGIDAAQAAHLLATGPAGTPPAPDPAALEAIYQASARKGRETEKLRRNKETIRKWVRNLAEGPKGRLPIPKADGEAGGIDDLYAALFAPLKSWLAAVGGKLAGELSIRYRIWRADRGIQTYADQLETALAVLADGRLLEAARTDGWRVILDEAQDTDEKQFSVLVEITRPKGAPRGSWPGAGPAPRPGHFCMVGDPQQAIYSKRANIENFLAHVGAFERGEGGEALNFDVTFRAPRHLAAFLNETLGPAFGRGRAHNLSPESELRQVPYVPMVAFAENGEGLVRRIEVPPAEGARAKGQVDRTLAAEARRVAAFIKEGGSAAVGANALGEICVLAPRKTWIRTIRDEFERAGVKTSLQVRQIRSGANPAYAWLCGLLAVLCDPENAFEWAGVLREVFAVGDDVIAESLRQQPLRWEEPGDYPAPVSDALRLLAPFIQRVDEEGCVLGSFAADLAGACSLAGLAAAVDPDGNVEAELDRLLAMAAEIGAEGAGPREWLALMLAGLDEGRSSGRPAPDAVNILTSHSAKGLEWPVVIPMGLWRKVSEPKQSGLRLVGAGAGTEVVLDNEGIEESAKARTDDARLRENCRLLYVTLTRARSALLIPWGAAPADKESFADLWGADLGALEALPPAAAGGRAPEAAARPEVAAALARPAEHAPREPLPRRVLPHQLTADIDLPRSAVHESSAEAPASARNAADPLEYGTWWHSTLQFVPWQAPDDAVAAYAESALSEAGRRGFRDRAEGEWGKLLASEAWHTLREARWSRLAEAGILAPLSEGEWIDGVIDLIVHDPASGELRIVDWKTNARREGEGDAALLGRMAETYAGQLEAYGASAGPFFRGTNVSLWLYSTAVGSWTVLPDSRPLKLNSTPPA